MKKLILAFAFGIGSLSLFAGEAVDAMTQDATVLMTSLSARQRYPWNGKVDIDFSFTCTIPEAFAFVNFKATYKDKDGNTVEVPMKTFDQFTTAFCTNAGTYRVTWDSVADAPNLRVTNLQYTVTANMAKYMVVDLSKGLKATADDPYPVSYLEECPDPTSDDGGWTDEYKTTKMVFRLIQPQKFKKGWNNNSFRNWNDAGAHDEQLTRPYYIGVFECTQGQVKKFYDDYKSDGNFRGGSRAEARPYGCSSYNLWRGSAAKGFCWPQTAGSVDEGSIIGQLRQRAGDENFDLPTESEWECAARAGTNGAWSPDDKLTRDGKPTSDYSATSSPSNTLLNMLGRYAYNGGMRWNGTAWVEPDYLCDETKGTAVVGSYKPNAWGLYDTLGNLGEMVLDYYNGTMPWSGTLVDYVGKVPTPEADVHRVIRGGGWYHNSKICSLAYRNNLESNKNQPWAGARLCWHFPYAPKSE